MEETQWKKAIVKLQSTCEAIAGGDFETMDLLFDIISDEDVPRDIHELAETFAGMVVQIEAREFHAGQLISELKETQRQLEVAQQELKKENTGLRQRLKKLEVQYDSQQAEQEIREIAESDYFLELQQRAKSLRTRFRKE